MEEPGSFAGKISSPKPHRGPEPNQRISLAIFYSVSKPVFSPRHWPLTIAIMRPLNAAKFIAWAEMKGKLVIWGNIFSRLFVQTVDDYLNQYPPPSRLKQVDINRLILALNAVH